MRPLRSFLLLLIFLACLTGLHYIIPPGELFPSVNDFFSNDLIKFVLSKSQPSIPVQSWQTSDILSIEDSLIIEVVDSFPPVRVNLILDPLNQFLDSLEDSRGQVRILYYGDSQIEGDRITSYIRQTLRKGHGGSGPGLFLPVMPVMYTRSVWIRSSSNWKRYTYLSYKSGELSHSGLGPFMAVCRFLPEGLKTSVPEKANIKIQPSKLADSTTSYYEKLRIFYGNCYDDVIVRVRTDDNEIYKAILQKGKGFYEIDCPLEGNKEIIIEFEGRVSPDIYGLSIESSKGVIVDNIPQRGSAGLEFTMVDRNNLAESYKKLHPDLFILHYGLNIVKNVRNDYLYYQKGMERQLALLKDISPETPVLFISVTDMAEKMGDSIKSYPNIPSIIEAQRKAALTEGAFFWNSFNAMGGQSAIVSWAGKNPPLAQKDFVHLTNPGSDTLAKILTETLFLRKKIDTVALSSETAGIDAILFKSDTLAKVERVPHSGETFMKMLIFKLFYSNPDKPLIFSTSAFWLFFLLVLAGYSLIYKKLFIRNFYLFLVSLFFYYKSGGLFLFLLLFVTMIDFSCGLLIFNSRRRVFKRVFVLFSIISNIGILAYFKYTSFIVNTLNDFFGTHYVAYDFLASFSNNYLGTSFNISTIILPVGISFFTFQSLSYTFDIYRGKLAPVRNIIDFGFYVSFFPQLVAGPIVRASEFIPQLYSKFHLGKREFSHAMFLISKGLIKKIIISDFIAVNFIDRVFDAPSVYSGFENLMAVYGYGLQIYCDFSGYTDIAIGLGLILGFRLPVNFNSPYKAAGIADFWKRWHISLSRWLKDYLYIPLGGNRKGKIRTTINLMITMLLGGLWHGAALRFIIWGALHGIGLVINRIWNFFFGERLRRGRIGKAIAVFITFQFVSFCWIFFRAPDTLSVKIMLEQIFKSFSPGSYMTVIPAYSNVFLLMITGYVIHFLPEKIKESYRGLFIRSPLIVQLLVMMVMAVMLYQMRSTDVMPFIYFRF